MTAKDHTGMIVETGDFLLDQRGDVFQVRPTERTLTDSLIVRGDALTFSRGLWTITPRDHGQYVRTHFTFIVQDLTALGRLDRIGRAHRYEELLEAIRASA